MNRKLALAAGAATLLAATAALAQNAPDYTLEPTFGATELIAGFEPDPHRVDLVAGGDIDAGTANLATGCAGFIAAAPDYRVQYTPGEYMLSFAVASAAGADTTLVINGPDGAWYCDDDSWGELSPLVSFDQPLAGQYDVWIGVYGAAASTAEATLFLSEGDPATFPTPTEALTAAPAAPATPEPTPAPTPAPAPEPAPATPVVKP
ncbi:MAG: hypothetical protein AB7O56_13170 [Bauldia sp.]